MKDLREKFGQLEQHSNERRQCDVDDCLLLTKKKKPFCLEHITLMPYVQIILTEIFTRSVESERIFKGGHVEKDCHLFEEVLLYIQSNGPSTIKMLAQRLDQEKDVIKRVLKYMNRNKMIQATQGRYVGLR